MSLIGRLRGLFRSDPEKRVAAESGHEERRRLTEGDTGRVFVRVDPNGHRDTYLCLRSLGGGSSPTASFVTFQVADGAAAHVSEAGYSIALTAERKGQRVIVIVMGSVDRKVRDAKAAELLAKGFLALPAPPPALIPATTPGPAK